MNIRWFACFVIAMYALIGFHVSEATPANIVGYTTLFLATIFLSLQYLNRSE